MNSVNTLALFHLNTFCEEMSDLEGVEECFFFNIEDLIPLSPGKFEMQIVLAMDLKTWLIHEHDNLLFRKCISIFQSPKLIQNF